MDVDKIYKWRVQSENAEGLHTVFAPGQSDCRSLSIYRLNISKNSDYCIDSGTQEMCFNLVKGAARLENEELGNISMEKLDCFYLPGGKKAHIYAVEDCVFYIGAAVCEGYGIPLFRKFDITLPLGDIHQIHGSGLGQREVMFTLPPQDSASRLICGLTWGGNGSWTSWPPHQHEKDLEEAYCYFDMDPPNFGLHLSYLKSGEEIQAVVHPVQSGTMVLAPVGYHPTVASPGTRNCYLWVLAAHSHASRRYDLAVLDPNYVDT